MSNPLKLAMVVLLFFLALTYVRGFSATGSSSDIVFSGNAPFAYSVTVDNSQNVPLRPSFLSDGPFTILIRDAPEDLIIPPFSKKTFQLYLSPSPILRVGDVYSASIRVASVNNVVSIPLLLHKQDAPLFGSVSQPIIQSPTTGTSASAASAGLLGGISISTTGFVNVILIIIILVLGVALFARIRNRVWGGTTQ